MSQQYIPFNNEFMIPQYGWICPKCEHVYSPSVFTCFGCGPKVNTSSSTVNVKIDSYPNLVKKDPPGSETDEP